MARRLRGSQGQQAPLPGHEGARRLWPRPGRQGGRLLEQLHLHGSWQGPHPLRGGRRVVYGHGFRRSQGRQLRLVQERVQVGGVVQRKREGHSHRELPQQRTKPPAARGVPDAHVPDRRRHRARLRADPWGSLLHLGFQRPRGAAFQARLLGVPGHARDRELRWPRAAAEPRGAFPLRAVVCDFGASNPRLQHDRRRHHGPRVGHHHELGRLGRQP
mmetsp:Transcript_126429/g.363686  ORF Transcript_126429/g.363686 Transcript_126429/m.363686 type:complete len:216 (-) Transcript_126429:1010-1657(-)